MTLKSGETQMKLHPTLWRTCRVLTGKTRLRLFRLVVDSPGTTVTRLAEQAKIGCSRASQELRRLQSRGLLRVEREGKYVRYFPQPDPQVPSARPILEAMETTFARSSSSSDMQIQLVATALSHPRRSVILRELLNGPRNIHALQASLRISLRPLYRHLNILQEGGLIRQSQMVFRIARNSHPLAKCLMALTRTSEKDK